MPVGITEVCGEKAPLAIGRHRTQLHFEWHTQTHQLSVANHHVVDLKNDLSQRLVADLSIHLIQNKLDPAAVEEHERSTSRCDSKSDLLRPETQGLTHIRNSQNDLCDLHTSKLGRRGCRKGTHESPLGEGAGTRGVLV